MASRSRNGVGTRPSVEKLFELRSFPLWLKVGTKVRISFDSYGFSFFIFVSLGRISSFIGSMCPKKGAKRSSRAFSTFEGLSVCVNQITVVGLLNLNSCTTVVRERREVHYTTLSLSDDIVAVNPHLNEFVSNGFSTLF